MDEIKNHEQKVINHVIEIVEKGAKNYFEINNKAKRLYYDTSLEWDEQRKFQEEYERTKYYLETYVNPFLRSPFIGRIDYLQTDGKHGTAYIGRRAYYGNEFIIHDWRSAKGQAFRSKKTFHEGHNVLLNRTLSIFSGELISYFDIINKKLDNSSETSSEKSSVNIHEMYDYKKMVESNKVNKDILTSLNQVQNQIIDLPIEENIILHGVPGSGKTAIGGYRLSSVAYRNNKDLNPSFKLLYITPNSLLKEHTVGFFDSIDMDFIEITTFEDVFNFSDISFHNDKTKKSVIFGKHKIKGKLTKNLDDNHGDYAEVKKTSGEIILCHESDIQLYKNTWNEHTKRIWPNNQIENTRNFLQHIKSKKLFMVMNHSISEEIILKLGNKIYRNKVFIDYERISLLADEILQKHFRFSLDKQNLKYFINFTKLYYLANHLVLYKPNIKVQSIFLDEAQDYTIMDLKLMKKRYPNATFTLCGDVNQCNGQSFVQNDWETLKSELNASLHSFLNCFRSSQAVIKLFNAYMTNNSYGKANPVVDIVGETKEALNFKKLLKKKNILNDNTCLIYMNLSTKKHLQKFTDNNVKLYHAYDVKGLEFKNIVLFDIEEINKNPQRKKFLYMLFSRALKNVYVVKSFR